MDTTREALVDALNLVVALEAQKRRTRLYQFYPEHDTPGFFARSKYPRHMEFFRLGKNIPIRYAMSGNGVGKAQPLGAKVVTLSGWKAIGEVAPGDMVATVDGTFTRVRAIYPQGEMDVYHVSFSDGSSTLATDEHLWPVMTRYERENALPHKVMRTSDIVARGDVGASHGPSIPAHVAVAFPEAALPLDPYLLGAFIADGYCSTKDANISIHGEKRALSERIPSHACGSCNDKYQYLKPWVRREIAALGLAVRSRERFIPAPYMRASIPQRVALLRGLCDADGSVDATGRRMSYSTLSPRLAADFAELVRSLGGWACVKSYERIKTYKGAGREVVEFSVAFHLADAFTPGTRKADRVTEKRGTRHRRFERIERVGRDQCVCIEVEHPSHLYLTDDYILTHNTEGMGGYEVAWHLRGEYPDWWEGVRFDAPIDCWIVGDTHESVREILQRKLLGNPYEEEQGGGLIPVDWVVIDSIKRMSQPAGRIDSFEVRNVNGGKSRVKLKSYDQGLNAFFGSEVPLIWLDEPPPVAIFSQCVARQRNLENPRILITATPVDQDPTTRETVRMFLETPDPSRVVIKAGWADAPHLSEEWKQVTRANTPAYLRKAVEFGDPTRMGGAVFPFTEDQITVDPFPIPKHWKWTYGMDTGFHHTACCIIAIDPDSDSAYLVEEYQDGGQDLRTGEVIDYTIHATRIASRTRIRSGIEALPGVADAAAINLKDGSKMIDLYRSCGLDLELPNKAVVAGLTELTSRFADGRLKVFNTCTKFLQQFREYSADDQGRPIKVNDHCLRGDTLVHTEGGVVPIVDLVGTEGRVRTTGGLWASYTNCRLTGRDQPIVAVKFDDWATVFCTPDHRFLTPSGWVEAMDLAGVDCYRAVPNSVHEDHAWSSPSSAQPAKSTEAAGTTAAASISSATAFAFTAWSGRMRTAARSLRGTMSTIWTRIAQTTSLATSNSARLPSTSPPTNWGTAAASLRQPLSPPRRGIGARPEWRGIVSTTRRWLTACMPGLRRAAPNAAPPTTPWPTAALASALTSARPLPAEHRGSMTLSGSAKPAALGSRSTDTRAPGHAAGTALARCVAVEPAGRADVYCMEVPETRAFAVENGVIVHNCIDALRYAVYSGIGRAVSRGDMIRSSGLSRVGFG